MLDVIGESPVSTVEDDGLVDAAMARDLLRKTAREVQSRGWHWNIDKRVELLPANPLPGIIVIPANALKCDPSDQSQDAVPRGSKLWSRSALTFLWSESVFCDITRNLPFEELPEVARAYIAMRSARMFQDRRIGSETANGFNERDETRALVTLLNDQAEMSNASMANSLSVQRVLNPWAPMGSRLL